jgi:hypothetical protein
MRKKLLFFLLLLPGFSNSMQQKELAGALMLTGGYYSLLEMSEEQSLARPNWLKRDRLLYAGVALNAAGLIALMPQLIKSHTPAFTAGKYIAGSFFLAKAAFILKTAKSNHDKFKIVGSSLHPDQVCNAVASARVVGTLGLLMVVWAMNDLP